MTKQHVGALSDALADKLGLDAAVAKARQNAAAVKPRALGPKYREGDGPVCPEPGDHGRTYVMASGNLWCPVSQALFGKDWVMLRRGSVKATAGETASPPSLPDIDMEGFNA